MGCATSTLPPRSAEDEKSREMRSRAEASAKRLAAMLAEVEEEKAYAQTVREDTKLVSDDARANAD